MTGLKSGVRYIFQIRAAKGSVKSAGSAQKEIIYYAAPTGITATKAWGSSLEYATVTVSWTKVSGYSGTYRVYRRVGSGSWSAIGDTSGTSFKDTKAKANTNYSYTVRCVSGSGYDHAGAAVSIGYKPGSQPTLLSPMIATGKTRVRWSSVSGASAYRVYRKLLSGNWAKVADVRGTIFDDTNVSKGVEYVYTVRCISDDGTFVTSDYDHTGVNAIAK